MAEMQALTAAQPEGSFFLEKSRERELSYIERSYDRWQNILQLALSRLPDPKNLSCLDVGSSPFTFLLPDVFKKVSALDLSDAFRVRCEAAGIKFYEGGVANDQAVAQVEKVDCIFFLEILEHLHANPVDVLRRLRSLLRDGGMLVLTTPNMMCLANRGLMLMNRKLRHFNYPPFFYDDAAHGFGHDRIYMPSELQDYFAQSGFSKVATLYQLHFYGTSQHQGLARRAWASAVLGLKNLWPSTKDGIVMCGTK